jgi:hypothetical protein
MPIIGMTQEEILLATAEQVAAGATSTARTSKLPGETQSEANERLTQGYRDLLARPVLTPELEEVGAEVRYVRAGGAGRGEYRIVTPFGTVIPAGDATEWSVGIIPSYSKYVTGSTLGMFIMGDGTVTNVGEVPVTTITKAGETSTRSFEGQDAYYTQRVGTTGKTQAQLDAAKGQEEALQLNKDIATLLGGTVGADGKVTGVAGKTVSSITPNADGTTTITASDGTKTTVRTPPSTTTPVTTSPTTVTPSGLTPSSGGSNLVQRIEKNRVTNADGTITITYTDGTKSTISAGSNAAGSNAGTNYTGSGSATDPFKLNGTNFTGTLGGVNYVNGVREDTAKRTAQQEFRASLADFGLGDLADVVDGFIRNDYTVSQIRLELPKTQSYKDRFPGMEALKAAGQAVNEATYISMERGYLQTLAAYGIETSTLGSRKQLGTYISNLVSPREFEERVNLAATRVKDNADVISQFKTYYPEVDNSALTAYLLNPMVGMDIIKKQVRLAEIGAAAMDVGFATGVSLSTAEELRGAVGEQDYQTIRSAFGQAKVLSDQQSRLARIEGTNYSQNEAIQGIVGRDIQSQMASQKRAERETMTRFGGRSGVTSTSLKNTEGI